MAVLKGRLQGHREAKAPRRNGKARAVLERVAFILPETITNHAWLLLLGARPSHRGLQGSSGEPEVPEVTELGAAVGGTAASRPLGSKGAPARGSAAGCGRAMPEDDTAEVALPNGAKTG